jgi:hypothetical protein
MSKQPAPEFEWGDYYRGQAKTQDAKYFVDQLNANIDNVKLTDTEFRQFVRNTLPIYTPKKKS